MPNVDEESKRYKNISRQEIEQLSGIEQEKAQLISGIHLSHKRTLKTVAELPKVEEYIAFFGHRPAIEGYKFLSEEEREKKSSGRFRARRADCFMARPAQVEDRNST